MTTTHHYHFSQINFSFLLYLLQIRFHHWSCSNACLILRTKVLKKYSSSVENCAVSMNLYNEPILNSTKYTHKKRRIDIYNLDLFSKTILRFFVIFYCVSTVERKIKTFKWSFFELLYWALRYVLSILFIVNFSCFIAVFAIIISQNMF